MDKIILIRAIYVTKKKWNVNLPPLTLKIKKYAVKYVKGLKTHEMLIILRSLLGSIIMLGMQLEKYNNITKYVWDNLTRLYVLTNFAKHYKMQIDIPSPKHNNNYFLSLATIIIKFYSPKASTK